MSRKTATFREFQDYTLAIVRGERKVDPGEPKVWCEQIEGSDPESPVAAAIESSLYVHSALRERIVEHIFVGHALQRLWERKAFDIEVLRSEFDAGGYDLVMSYGEIVRHIQLKSVIEGGKTGRVNVSLKLAEKPSGCVILLVVSPKNLEIKSYRWFGGVPGKPLTNIKGMKVAKHPKANAKGIKLEKPDHRVVPLREFTPPLEIDEVLDRLFVRLP